MSHISVKNLSVEFPLYSASQRSLKSNIFSVMNNRSATPTKTYSALNDVSFDILSGDRVCLVGLNGAGKTTLLRALAGILPPTKGTIEVTGSVSPLLDFATGFEMEMTGHDNILARGMFLGVPAAQMRLQQNEIAEFSGLGDFIYEPVKTYSAGMFVRLAFAIITSIEPEILIVDEIVGAGDKSFAKKAQDRMISLIEKGSIVVLATHSTNLALELCNKGIWLEDGKIVTCGDIEETIRRYVENDR
ncbi:ABC transporter ATP-binding protein [Ahrensia sp. 13_GOM-1096m]|uniref:ABC transporter ATP-binding protein n=1 Tax=Ahrensia sp. 13_GOM-1096m TaxID=1380380 RepID=UPI0005562763|nr:ABC transporter ATP-binding protein [Ahrensia sp. 13_GOM-1096m]